MFVQSRELNIIVQWGGSFSWFFQFTLRPGNQIFELEINFFFENLKPIFFGIIGKVFPLLLIFFWWILWVFPLPQKNINKGKIVGISLEFFMRFFTNYQGFLWNFNEFMDSIEILLNSSINEELQSIPPEFQI